MEIELFEHNEYGYQKLEEMLKKCNLATINHATGTGKSFIALKYIDNHKNKKGLYIAPTYEILKQVTTRDAKTLNISNLNIDTMIYRNLLDLDMKYIFDKYDYFILDEYHRAGASKTNKKLSELKSLVKYSSKKLIGLTATPIRYLDSERNMTDELFDGNVASTISLPDALIEGILPAPTYVISSLSLYEEYQKVRNKVNKLFPSKLKEKLDCELEEIFPLINPNQMLPDLFEKHIKKNGKYIIFCSTIKDLYSTMKKSETWFKNFNFKKYMVNSNMTKQQIDEQIQMFDEASEGLNLMFAINIFSEGVHPKNVDGVIFNRKTTSPIIIFQQMGRAMSSSNKTQTVIIDLKNNFNAHPVINGLYKKLEKLAFEKIKTNPEKEKDYQKILDNFKLVDNCTGLMNSLNDIKDKVTKENIIYSKLEYTIELLQKYKEENNINKIITSLDLKGDIKNYYYYLYKYQDYITINHLSKLKEINVLLPADLMVSLESRIEQLDGFENMFLKKQHELEQNKQFMFKYLQKKVPKENDKFFDKYVDLILYTSNKKELKQLLENKNIDIWTKLLLDIEVTENEVIDNFNRICTLKDVPKYLKQSLYKSLNYGFSINEKIIPFLNLCEKTDNNKFALALDYIDNDVDEDVLMEYLFVLTQKERNIVLNKLNRKKQREYYQIINNMKYTMGLSEFIKVCKYLDEDNLNLFYKKIKDDFNTYNIIYDYIEYYIKNDDYLENSEYQKLIADGIINDNQIKSLINEDVNTLIKIILLNIKELELKDFVARYVLYYIKNGRRPLNNSFDEDEALLALEFETNREKFKKTDLDCLNNNLNTKEAVKKASSAYAQNKIRQRNNLTRFKK